ncbi:MAG: hypothetical protein WBP31_09435 [Chitinophagales bacterium]|jgi:preprotein translocase subunit SecG|nr:hypothetical protein [Bacteroidota bacterium]MBK9554617.1 hypothetical protein [Bacteroidota bacterium]MBL0282028.1 hypothetical protein [Bacteroidota bacterium]MBP8248522.1 hypothetical protein [Chitinophagales bacterium]MBP9879216.1 hypothetical protein [Chitinophagales bacterium]
MEPITPTPNNNKIELTAIYNMVNQHMVTFYSKRILRFTIEFTCYFLCLLALYVALFELNLSVSGSDTINGEIIFYDITTASAQKVANVMKVITIMAGLLFLTLGLYIRNVRRHHETVRLAAVRLNEVIKKM